jgi:hypothetical protein
MTIKEAIERGLYPKDEKGRALVPTDKPNVRAVIAADDCPVGEYLLGWSITSSARQEIGDQSLGGRDYCWRVAWWRRDGKSARPEEDANLLPPAPRKVEVKRYVVLTKETAGTGCFYTDPAFAERDWGYRLSDGTAHIVELTGSYEEPWS